MGAGDLTALLRELKERSGLSYGVLAKRLHLSTSTLHRYVNGTAVPTEFAPVERLARLCRATPEELVEVHRRWIVADAARGRRTADPAAQKTEPEPEREPDPEQPESEQPEPEQPLPVQQPAPEGKSGPPPATTSPSAPSTPHPLSTPRIPRIPRIPRARRLAAVVGVGVALALGATALAVQGGSGTSGTSGTAAEASPDGAGRPATGTPGAGGPEHPPSGTAGTGAKGRGTDGPGTDDANGSGADGKGTGDTASPGATAPGGGRPATGTPLTVSTQPQFWDSPCGHPYLLDRAPSALTPPPNEQDAPGWVSVYKAVSAGEQTVRLIVQGTGEDTVVLESLHVRVVGSDAPLAWNDYAMGYVGVGCGGDVPKHSFDTNLDASVPRLTPSSDAKDDFPYTVSAHDPETFYVNATVRDHHVRWYLELTWSSGGRRGTMTIGDTGQPFRTSGDQGRPQYGYSLDKKAWVRIRRGPDGSVTELPDGA
ncbi:helix-turn-helix domain-containing protein [Streptomyces sp. NPDC090442]|uniref:transcriptional regulator n=1 Tax=Streptomyces sp. NPDC090442 TaxID=3365962 RepID=UPI00382F7DD2